MKVSLGSVEVDDEMRKAIRVAIGGKGHATRDDVRDYAIDAVNKAFDAAKNPPAVDEPEAPASSDGSWTSTAQDDGNENQHYNTGY